MNVTMNVTMECCPEPSGNRVKFLQKPLLKHFCGSTTLLTWSTIFNDKWPGLLEMYLYNGTFGIRLDARDILKRW